MARKLQAKINDLDKDLIKSNQAKIIISNCNPELFQLWLQNTNELTLEWPFEHNGSPASNKTADEKRYDSLMEIESSLISDKNTSAKMINHQ